MSRVFGRPSVLSLLPIVIMAGSVELFQFFQRFHQTIGIAHGPLPNQKQYSNSMKAIFLIILIQIVITTVAFLLFEAQISMFDYCFGFCCLITLIESIDIYLLFIQQSEDTMKFIKNCEGFIEKSEKYSEHCHTHE